MRRAAPAGAQGNYPRQADHHGGAGAAGRGTDLISRLYSDLLSQELGQQ